MSNPSRFDNSELLSGVAGGEFDRDFLRPEVNRYQCDIRLVDDKSPLLTGTKTILLLGEKAHKLYTGASTTLDENRGSPIIKDGIPCISTFTAQDCYDFKNYERDNNPHYQTEEEYSSEETDAGEIIESKGRGSTARSNYMFWVKQDVKKALRILANGGKLPSEFWPTPEYILRPSSQELINVLSKTKNDVLHIDIETDFITLDIRCIAFAFESSPSRVYIFQVLDTNYKPAYDNLPHIFRALCIAFRDNTTVAHNGAMFDFLVFAYKYRIPVGRKLYDTLVAQSRIYPVVEKSLGHCVSLYTYQPYHKNEGVHSYGNEYQARQLMEYCGKDVYTMMLVKRGQQELMEKDEGLRNSIIQANRAVRPMLITTYTGMKYDEEARQAWIKENDRKMMQYLRIMKILMGDDVQPLISNKKDVEYFHNRLGYKAVDKTPNGAPSLKGEALLKLKAQYPKNVVIDFLIRYRETKKETGTLQFKPWIT